MRVLLVEDELALSKALCAILERSHYAVDVVDDGLLALTYLEKRDYYDVVILDIMLPGLDGISVLRKIREDGNLVPVLVLSAKAEIDDKVIALDTGANDYMSKPFSGRELLARLRALTRVSMVESGCMVRYGNVVLNRSSFELSTPYGMMYLANKEFQILEMLMQHPKNVISVDQFMEKIWGYDSESESNVVWVYISYLRKKLSSLQADVGIHAMRGVGYFLKVNHD